MNGLDCGPRDDVRADDDGDAELFGLLGSGEVQKTAYKQVFGMRKRSDTKEWQWVPQIELIQSIGDYGFIFYKVFGTKYRSVGRFRYLKLIRHKWLRLRQNPSLIITHLNTNEPVSVDVANSKLSGSEFLRFLNQITTMLIREFVANSNFM